MRTVLGGMLGFVGEGPGEGGGLGGGGDGLPAAVGLGVGVNTAFAGETDAVEGSEHIPLLAEIYALGLPVVENQIGRAHV